MTHRLTPSLEDFQDFHKGNVFYADALNSQKFYSAFILFEVKTLLVLHRHKICCV